jgi:hypothetical protein
MPRDHRHGGGDHRQACHYGRTTEEEAVGRMFSKQRLGSHLPVMNEELVKLTVRAGRTTNLEVRR